MNDLRVRQAMAYAIDRKSLDDISQTDPLLRRVRVPTRLEVVQPQPNYPGFDLAKAKALVQQYEDDHGPVEFNFGDQPDNDVLQDTQAIATMWSAVGIKVDIQTFDQPTFVGKAVTGNYR